MPALLLDCFSRFFELFHVEHFAMGRGASLSESPPFMKLFHVKQSPPPRHLSSKCFT
jgi:hypothetical protein